MSTLLSGFESLSEADKVKTILCPATTKAAKLTNRFIETMFKAQKKIDEKSKTQNELNQDVELDLSDSDEN